MIFRLLYWFWVRISVAKFLRNSWSWSQANFFFNGAPPKFNNEMQTSVHLTWRGFQQNGQLIHPGKRTGLSEIAFFFSSRIIIFLGYVCCSDWKAMSGKEWFHISRHASQILEIKSERKLSICVKGTLKEREKKRKWKNKK